MENNKNDNRKPENPVTQPDPKSKEDGTKKITDPKLNPHPKADTGNDQKPPAIPKNDADKIITPDQHEADTDPKTMPDTRKQQPYSENKSNPAADGDGKTGIDHHKKETEELKPKADPFKRTDYHQPTPDEKFAAANKENMEKHANTVNTVPQDTASQQEEQTADQTDDSISGSADTTKK